LNGITVRRVEAKFQVVTGGEEAQGTTVTIAGIGKK